MLVQSCLSQTVTLLCAFSFPVSKCAEVGVEQQKQVVWCSF